MLFSPHTKRAGFTLIEVLIVTSVFAMLGIAIYSMGIAAVRGLRAYRESATVAALADQYMEIARNLPYSQLGTISGNPTGPLSDLPNARTVVSGGDSYKVYYVVNNVSDPSDGAVLPETDYKQVKVYVQSIATGKTVSFTTTMVPQGLGGAGGGALSLQVINAVGEPVPNATLHITDNATSPPIDLTRTADASGDWIEVGLPTSTNSYHVVATKSGYSSDQTYPSSGSNPDPTKPDATVLGGTVTAISFAIDQESALTLQTVDQACQPLPGIGLELQGSKLIGTPDVLKFDNTYATDGSGQVVIDPIEWDSYAPTVTTPGYMIYGSSPADMNLLPDTDQTSTLILGPSTPNSLLVVVTDAATGNPIEGATVELADPSAGYDTTELTAGSVLSQQDWSGGPGQADFSAANQYYQDDGNVDTATLPTGVRLAQSAGAYDASGSLVSSAFDTGTASSSYTTLTWNPASQSPSTTLAFQLATNNDDATWNFIGPDGTASSYYTTPGETIAAASNDARYLRYEAFLGSASTTTTPVLSNVSVNYMSGCFAPGQAMFAGIGRGGGYTLTVSMPGYATQASVVAISGYNTLQVQLSH